jgi:hypothetical protein
MGVEGVEPRLAETAEAVRAYLVSVRGGAPLLSSADARLLHGWLSGGVRLGAIVRAIDLVAERRQARRARVPLSLSSCRSEVLRQQAQAGAWVRRGGVRRVVAAPEEADARFAPVDRLAAATEAAVAALPAGDGERLVLAACALAARFVEEAWALSPQAVLRAEAEAALADARALYDDAAWEEAVASTARDHLRRRYPSLTATALWQELGPGLD